MASMKLGDIQLDLIRDAEILISGDSVFHPAGRSEWTAAVPANEHGEFVVPVRPLLIRESDETTLIDTGYGSIAADEYNAEDRGDTLEELGKLGVSPEDIDRVIITHAHGDHIQGNTRRIDGEITATFPNAEYVVQRLDAENVQSESSLTWSLYFEPMARDGKLKIIDGDNKLSPSLFCTLTQGHTIGHQSVIINSGGNFACYMGDLALHLLNLDRPEWGADWAWSKDHDRDNRIRIKQWALETEAVLILPHDSEHPFVTIDEDLSDLNFGG